MDDQNLSINDDSNDEPVVEPAVVERQRQEAIQALRVKEAPLVNAEAKHTFMDKVRGGHAR